MYDGYGVLLGGNPTSGSPTDTALLYTGEQFDTAAQMYYLRVRDHGVRNKETGVVTQGWGYRKWGTTMDPYDVERMCPFLCKGNTLKLMGCDVGENSRSGFLEYFNACGKIGKIEACTGDVILRTAWCPFGWWKTFQR